MNRASNKNDIKLCIDEANAFLDVADYSHELDKKNNASSLLFRDEAFYFLPAIINLSFATELYLKALIMICSNQYPHVHELESLFNSLPENIKEELNRQFTKKCKYAVTISETLKVHQEAFVKWRYAFEQQNNDVEAYYDNLHIAAEVVREKISEINN